MTTPIGEAKLSQIPCDIYTPNTRSRGFLSTFHQRFSDALNAADQDFLLLRNTHTVSLGDDALEANAASALVRKDSVVLAIPHDSQDTFEVAPERQRLYVHKRSTASIVEAAPFVIRGTLHMPAANDLLQHAHDPFRLYIPITDAEVTHNTVSSLRFHAPFLLLNRRYVEVMVETEQLDRIDELEADEPPLAPMEVDAAHAAAVLLGTPIFAKIPTKALEVACAQMAVNGSLTRFGAKADTELFRQGDVGKAIYAIEAGELAVARKHAVTGQIEDLGAIEAGQIAGEMVLVGDGRRTTTARAKGDVTLLAVDIAAVKALMHEFPSAASSLLRIMLDREGGIDISRRSLPHEARAVKGTPVRGLLARR